MQTCRRRDTLQRGLSRGVSRVASCLWAEYALAPAVSNIVVWVAFFVLELFLLLLFKVSGSSLLGFASLFGVNFLSVIGLREHYLCVLEVCIISCARKRARSYLIPVFLLFSIVKLLKIRRVLFGPHRSLLCDLCLTFLRSASVRIVIAESRTGIVTGSGHQVVAQDCFRR